jgi:ADP-heptose:LPS heptosyltransferase
MDYDAQRILVCLRYGIGDVVMELPVLNVLRRAVPDARITALGASPAVELLEDDPVVDEVVSLRRWDLTHRWDNGTEATRPAIRRWLDRNDFDLFLDVHHVTPVFGEVVWSRGVRSLEADEAAEAAVVAKGADGVHAIKAAVRTGWGLEVPETSLPHLPLREADRRFARAFLREHAIDSPPIGISPVASHTLKRWPTERFAAVADRMVEETGLRVLLFCGPQEQVGDEVHAAMRYPDHVVRVGAFHLQRVGALLARCRTFLCNDTGLMHMSAAAGTPTIAVFGPTAPKIYLPPARHAVSAGATRIECSHLNTDSLHPPECFAEGRCLVAEHGCIHQVQEAEVLEAVWKAMGGAHEPPAETAVTTSKL